MKDAKYSLTLENINIFFLINVVSVERIVQNFLYNDA